jgi:UDP-glucose 4-epimerase
MSKAIDLGGFYRIPADNRDLNYAMYFAEGEVKTSAFEDYHSHNTKRLTLDETKTLLLSLDFIKDELKSYKS